MSKSITNLVDTCSFSRCVRRVCALYLTLFPILLLCLFIRIYLLHCLSVLHSPVLGLADFVCVHLLFSKIAHTVTDSIRFVHIVVMRVPY